MPYARQFVYIISISDLRLHAEAEQAKAAYWHKLDFEIFFDWCIEHALIRLFNVKIAAHVWDPRHIDAYEDYAMGTFEYALMQRFISLKIHFKPNDVLKLLVTEHDLFIAKTLANT